MVDCVIHPLALEFCPQRCRTRWISTITSVWWTEAITDVVIVIGKINVSLLSTNYAFSALTVLVGRQEGHPA